MIFPPNTYPYSDPFFPKTSRYLDHLVALHPQLVFQTPSLGLGTWGGGRHRQRCQALPAPTSEQEAAIKARQPGGNKCQLWVRKSLEKLVQGNVQSWGFGVVQA